MTKLIEFIQSQPSRTAQLIGVTYDEYNQILQAAISSGKFLHEPEQFKSNSEYSLRKTSGSLSLSEQVLALLLIIQKDCLLSTSLRLGVSQASLLAVYFETSDQAIDNFLYGCSNLFSFISSQLNLVFNHDSPQSLILSATTYAYDTLKPLLICQNFGFSPECIYDIGASTGAWTRVVHQLFPYAHYHLFEPLATLPSYNQALELTQYETGCKVYPYALGARDGTSTIAVTPDLVGSSILVDQESDFFPTILDVSVMSLDSFISKTKAPYPQLIKIDTQGYELSILEGAMDTLQHVDMIMLESWLVRGYGPDTPLLVEIATWLAYHDFYLFDTSGGYRDAHGMLIAPDCVFVRANSPLVKAGENRIVDLSKVNLQ